MRKSLLFTLIILLCFCFQSCGQNTPSKTSSEQESYTYGDLEEVYDAARKTPNIRSMVISHKDSIIAEEYFDSYSSDSLDHQRSVTKSVMATLIGIAIDRGIIKSADESIAKYLGEAANGKENISIKDLMTMRSGIKWSEGASGYNAWVRSGDHINYVLNKPQVQDPGTSWNYNSAGTHLLSVILTKASGMNTLAFAKKYLFEPLGIKKVRWETLTGYTNGGAGLELKPRDMVKFGQLYSQNGLVNGNRILSESFVKDATHMHHLQNATEGSREGYGYCWWLTEYKGSIGYAALGYGGQTILIFPDSEIIIALTFNWRVNQDQAVEQQQLSLKKLAVPALDVLLEK